MELRFKAIEKEIPVIFQIKKKCMDNYEEKFMIFISEYSKLYVVTRGETTQYSFIKVPKYVNK